MDIKLLHGDCLELMKDIPDKSVDMILCDLPYGTTDCKWDTIIPFEPLWEQYKRVIKDNGGIVFCNPPFCYLKVFIIKFNAYEVSVCVHTCHPCRSTSHTVIKYRFTFVRVGFD